MTLTPWSHALAEDTKRPTKQPTTTEKTTKMRKKHCFRGTRGLYYWQVTYHTRVDSTASHMYNITWFVPLTSCVSYVVWQQSKSRINTRYVTVQSATRVWLGKTPKKVKKFLKKAVKVFYQTKKVFLSGNKDLKTCKILKERQRNPKQTRLSPTESPVLL